MICGKGLHQAVRLWKICDNNEVSMFYCPRNECTVLILYLSSVVSGKKKDELRRCAACLKALYCSSVSSI